MVRKLGIGLLFLCLAVRLGAEEAPSSRVLVRLKSGETLEGELLGYGSRVYQVRINGALQEIAEQDVAKIEFIQPQHAKEEQEKPIRVPFVIPGQEEKTSASVPADPEQLLGSVVFGNLAALAQLHNRDKLPDGSVFVTVSSNEEEYGPVLKAQYAQYDRRGPSLMIYAAEVRRGSAKAVIDAWSRDEKYARWSRDQGPFAILVAWEPGFTAAGWFEHAIEEDLKLITVIQKQLGKVFDEKFSEELRRGLLEGLTGKPLPKEEESGRQMETPSPGTVLFQPEELPAGWKIAESRQQIHKEPRDFLASRNDDRPKYLGKLTAEASQELRNPAGLEINLKAYAFASEASAQKAEEELWPSSDDEHARRYLFWRRGGLLVESWRSEGVDSWVFHTLKRMLEAKLGISSALEPLIFDPKEFPEGFAYADPSKLGTNLNPIHLTMPGQVRRWEVPPGSPSEETIIFGLYTEKGEIRLMAWRFPDAETANAKAEEMRQGIAAQTEDSFGPSPERTHIDQTQEIVVLYFWDSALQRDQDPLRRFEREIQRRLVLCVAKLPR